MKTLILGGVKSGKSRQAQALAVTSKKPVTLIATALASDSEMAQRIDQHKADRPNDWHLVEEPYSLGTAIENIDNTGQCIVVDCLTLWLTQLLVKGNASLLHHELASFKNAVSSASSELIIVSNENNMGIIPMGELSRRYCDEAGMLHQSIAAECDRAMLCVAGLPLMLKGDIPN
ncbi:UNVERIFIED_CONTAM: hypothetical protein GTU68_051162 [Idotea baltica]|nr:hypothetical protein [Idotea baltica]